MPLRSADLIGIVDAGMYKAEAFGNRESKAASVVRLFPVLCCPVLSQPVQGVGISEQASVAFGRSEGIISA